MSANNSASDGGQDKSAPEATVQTVPQNLTTIQSIQTVQGVQNVVPSSIQSIQTAQTVTGQTTTLVGKQISLELNPKLLMKSPIGSNVAGSSDSKIASTFCTVPGQTVRIITPNMLSSMERQPQVQQASQQTNIPSTYHVPRGPAAVASISTPRATVATPLRTISQPISRPGTIIVAPGGPMPVISVPNCTERLKFARVSVIDYAKSSTSIQPRMPPKHDKQRRASDASSSSCSLINLSVSRSTTLPSIATTVVSTAGSTQWQPKTTSVVYAQQQPTPRQPVPVVRPPARPVTATVYTSQGQQQQPQQQQQQQQQPRLVSPGQISVQGRPIQATVVTATSRLMTPVQLQASNSTITRLPAPTRPLTPQVVTSMPQVSQAGRAVQQAIQPNQTSRAVSTPISRIAVSAPVIGASNRVATVTSVQTGVGRQLTINTAAGASTGTVSRIVIPQQAIQQQQQQQQQQQNAPRVVQTVTPLANFTQVSRVIATTSSAAAVAARVAQTGPPPVARIAGMSLHPLPLTPARTAPQGTPLKVTTQTPTGTTIQTVQLKQATTTIQSQQQQQQSQVQQQQPQQQQQQSQAGPSTLPRQIGLNSVSVASSIAASQQPTQVQGQYLHSQHTTYYSIEPQGAYSQFRQSSVQPVRLLVEQGYEEATLAKPNASPRPSILRKREHDGSPGKLSVAKNLVPVLAALPTTSSHVSPPSSPKGDRDNGGNHSSGSTTVSATSSPGLDEEPEQSRITINPTVEMSPRKKPRKQQLTGVELTESRCTEEEMQFITEEKFRKEIKEEPKENYSERKHGSGSQQEAKSQQATTKNRPTLLEPGYKNQYNGRMHHFKRPGDVKAKVENKPTIYEIAQEKDVMKRLNGWKVHHLTAQMEDLSSTEKSVYEKLRGTLTMLENQQSREGQNDQLEKVNELIKGNMQRSNLISDGMNEARTQLTSMFVHKPRVTELLQRCMNKRAQKKREK